MNSKPTRNHPAAVFDEPVLNEIVEREARRGNSFHIQETCDPCGAHKRLAFSSPVDRVEMNPLLRANRDSIGWDFGWSLDAVPRAFSIFSKNGTNRARESIVGPMPSLYGENPLPAVLVPRRILRFLAGQRAEGNPIVGIHDSEDLFKLSLGRCFQPPPALRIPLLRQAMRRFFRIEWIEQKGPWVGFESGVYFETRDGCRFIVSWCSGHGAKRRQ